MYHKILLSTLFAILFAVQAFTQNNKAIWVDGACGMCKERIETAALQLAGIELASWDENTKILTINVTDDFYEDDLHTHMNSIGHDTKLSKAPLEIYQQLHSCCQYRMTANENDLQIELSVMGICEMCKERIETVALDFKNIEAANWDIATNMLYLTVKDSDIDLKKLSKKLNRVGHDTEISLASDKEYDSIDPCCRYRDEDVIDSHKDGESNQGEVSKEGDSEEEDNSISNALNKYTDHEGHPHGPDFIRGIIYETLKSGQMQPVIGANVYWAGTEQGVSSDVDGYFEMDPVKKTNDLVVSYIGYQNDTIDMTDQKGVEIMLKNNFILDEVNITHRKKTTEISFISTFKVQSIGQKELLKAACCNLSESFETNPSIDVSFTDAVTGTRKIEMLGLAGPYVQVMRENMPNIRGLAALYGFSYTPGPWIESMQLNMGAASVINGPEAMTGQINVEIKKPGESEKLYLNAYANEAQRLEINLNGSTEVNDSWSTAYLVHANKQNKQRDRNSDGFMDLPLNEQLIAMNRWKYSNQKGLQSQFGIKGTYIDKISGQVAGSESPQNPDLWTANVRTERMEGWFKMGKVFHNNPNQTIGFQLTGVNHIQDAIFGSRQYDADQQSLYSNFIYQTALKNTDHKFRLGASFQFDNYNEQLLDTTFTRREYLPGVYSEYQYAGSEKWGFIAGLRADHHNQFGLFFTPRIHLKYGPNETTAWRLVFGRGQRTASIFAENIGIFASNRQVVFHGNDQNKPYGLNQEIAWNSGINFTKEFIVYQRSMILSLDYYYTFFQDQILFDYDVSPREVHIYNLDGDSYSHSVQAQVDYELVRGVDLRLAYRFNDVKTEYMQGLLQKPLTARHRAFVNLGWEFLDRWNYDITVNYQGTKRIPTTEINPLEFRMPAQSPGFFTVNTQISKSWKNGVELYLGAENLLDFRQENAILSFEDTESPFFDSSLIWGPINGRMVYMGVRYKLF